MKYQEFISYVQQIIESKTFDVDPTDKLKPVPSVKEIAKKHGASIKEVNDQIKKGTKIEAEHTEDIETAKQIAQAHVDEILDYYDRLKTIEEASIYTKPKLRETIKKRIMAGDKGGKPGEWSARKSQMLIRAYEDEGGGYKTKGRTKKQRDLKQWSKEDWSTHDEKPSIVGQSHQEVDVYLPDAAIRFMKREDQKNGTNLFGKMTRQKRKATKEGKQFADYSDDVKDARKRAKKYAEKLIKQRKD